MTTQQNRQIMKRYSTMLIALVLVAGAMAQTPADTINRMVLVESTYNPIIAGAVKHSFIPEEVKPNGLILSYPVITSGDKAHRGSFSNLLGEGATEEQLESVSLEKQVTSAVPPTFIWHTVGDQLVPVENTLLFTTALQNAGVKFEMHVYPQGVHGLALATDETASRSREKYGSCSIRPECAAWVGMAGRFVREEV